MGVSVDHIVDALASLGGKAHLEQLVARVAEIAPPPLPHDVGASVRARLQERCAESPSYKSRENLFYSVYGLDERRGWWGLRADPLSVDQPDSFQDGADAFLEDEEGRATLRIHLRRERSSKLVRAFKEGLASCRCAVCGFDFEAVYGELGKGYIEAHHVVPVAQLEDGGKTKLSDLIALCSNCHRIIHRNGLLDWRELRSRLQRGGLLARRA